MDKIATINTEILKAHGEAIGLISLPVRGQQLADHKCFYCDRKWFASIQMTVVKSEDCPLCKKPKSTTFKGYKRSGAESNYLNEFSLYDSSEDGFTGTSGKKASRIACEWIDNVSNLTGLYFSHHLNGGEVEIETNSGFLHVDGFNRDESIVLEFHGSKWHGDPAVYKYNDLCNPFSDETASELYQKTMQKDSLLIASGYKVISIWESEYRNGVVLSDEHLELLG